MGIVQGNLSLYLEAALANGGVGPGLNSPLTTTFKDLSGLGNNGTLTNFGFTTASGWAGSGTSADPYRLVFDGTNDYVAVPTLHACDDKIFSYEFWFMRSGAPSAIGALASEANSASANLYPYTLPYIFTDGTPRLQVKDAAGTQVQIICTVNVCDGAWHHIVGTADGTYMYLYVDGVLKGGPTALPSGALGPTGWTTVGALRANSTPGFWYYLSGGVAVARIYDRTLSAAEVATNTAAGYTLLPRGGGRFLRLPGGVIR